MDRVSMSLYSSESLSVAENGDYVTNQNNWYGREKLYLSLRINMLSWYYVHVRSNMQEHVFDILKQRFNVFVHKTTIYKREKKHVVKKDIPTISGLVFVQGNMDEIQSFLKERCFGIYLAKDKSTGRPAVIQDKYMQAFIRLSQISPFRLRFMPHPLEYYSEGHLLVKITSGMFDGLEGYQIRISRDKCLITTLGGLTIAIGGICKENFENIEDNKKET